MKRREPGHEDDEDLSNIPSVASKSGSNQDLRELQRQEEARAHPPAPVPANLFPQQLPPQHLQPQHPPAVEEQRRPSQTEGAAKKLDEKRPSFTDAASSTTMKERRPSFTIIETGKKSEVKVEVKTAAALLFKDDSEEKAAPPAAAPAPATTSSSAANIAVAASSSVSVPLLNKVNRLEIVVTETSKVPAVKPPGSNATTPVAAAQTGKTEPPAAQPAPVSRKPSLLKSAYSELIAKKEEKKLDEKKPSFIIPSKPPEAKKAAAAAATTTTEPPKETTPVPSPKNADQPQPTAANVTAPPVTSHYVEPKPVPGHHPAHHPLSSSSSSGKHAHEEHPPKAHVPEEELQETQRPLSTTISSNKPFSSSAPAPASAPVREEPPKVETQPVKADNRLSKSLSFKLFGSATAAEPAIQPEKVEEKAADQPATVVSSSGALGSKSQEEAKVPTYRRASDAVNKLFNKYQPNKKKTEEPAPAPVPSAQDKEKEKEREAERQREEQERIQKEKERELEREREKERERQRLEEEKERERVEREKQKALEVEKQREAERIAREKELEQEQEREKEKAKANVHLKDPVGGDDAPFLRKNPSPALAFPPKAMSYDETTPKKMHGDIHQDGFVASTTHTEEKSPLQLNNGTSPVPSSRDDLTISPSSGEKSPAASSFLENLKRIKEGGAASSPPPQSSGPAITTSSLKKPVSSILVILFFRL